MDGWMEGGREGGREGEGGMREGRRGREGGRERGREGGREGGFYLTCRLLFSYSHRVSDAPLSLLVLLSVANRSPSSLSLEVMALKQASVKCNERLKVLTASSMRTSV